MSNQIILENSISEHFTAPTEGLTQRLQFDDIAPLVTALTAFSAATEEDIEDVVTGWDSSETHANIAQAIVDLQTQRDTFMAAVAAPVTMSPDTGAFLNLMDAEIAEAQAVLG